VTKRRSNRAVPLSVLAIALALPPIAAAQDDADALAKQPQNPVASLISVPLQGNWDFGLGDRDDTSTVLNIQPVMPFGISPWTVGLLFNQIWSTSGANDRADVNRAFLQPFANYNLGGGLSTGVSMEATANWDAHQTWSAPLLFNVSTVTRLGTRPVNFQAAAGPNVASQDGGASWRFRSRRRFCSHGNSRQLPGGIT
jgi:hypothetical protein